MYTNDKQSQSVRDLGLFKYVQVEFIGAHPKGVDKQDLQPTYTYRSFGEVAVGDLILADTRYGIKMAVVREVGVAKHRGYLKALKEVKPLKGPLEAWCPEKAGVLCHEDYPGALFIDNLTKAIHNLPERRFSNISDEQVLSRALSDSLDLVECSTELGKYLKRDAIKDQGFKDLRLLNHTKLPHTGPLNGRPETLSNPSETIMTNKLSVTNDLHVTMADTTKVVRIDLNNGQAVKVKLTENLSTKCEPSFSKRQAKQLRKTLKEALRAVDTATEKLDLIGECQKLQNALKNASRRNRLLKGYGGEAYLTAEESEAVKDLAKLQERIDNLD